MRLSSSKESNAKGEADEQERQNSEETLYELTVMVIGLTGTGKSALINSLLGRDAVSADAFEGTKNVSPRHNTACTLLKHERYTRDIGCMSTASVTC